MTPSEFINLCKQTTAVAYDPSLCHIQIVPTEKGVNHVETSDPWTESLTEALTPQDDEESISYKEIHKLKRGIVNETFVNGNGNGELALDLLATLQSHIGNKFDKFRAFDNPVWDKVVSLLKGYHDYSRALSDFKFHDKDIDRAKTAVELRESGFGVTVDADGNLRFTDIDAIYGDLENRVRNMGGRFVIEKLLASLNYSKELNRFILPRRGNNPDPFHPITPDIPYNYILNVALKCLDVNGRNAFQTIFYYNQTVERFAKICFVTMSAQSYSIWEDIFHRDKSPIEYMRDLVLRESVFSLHQSSWRGFMARYVKFICRSIGERHQDISVEYFHRIIDRLASLSKETRFREITLKDISFGRIPKDEIKAVMNCVSQPITDFNSGFIGPTDYDKINFWLYPIAEIEKGKKWLLMPRNIAARGWFEALLEFVRCRDIDIDREVGTYIENYVRKLCSDHGISLLGGKYTDADGLKVECDGLIECDKEILLIEMKKKGLIRASLGGDIINILPDLSLSLLNSQMQNFRTSCTLEKCRNESKPLKIDDNGTIHKVELRDRSFERISLVQFPFGDLQDRCLLEEILKIFLEYDFTFVSEENTKKNLTEEEKEAEKENRRKYKGLKKNQEKLRSFIGQSAEKRPLFNSWMIDLERFTHIVRDVKGSEEFLERLRAEKFVTFGTFDPYAEEELRKPFS